MKKVLVLTEDMNYQNIKIEKGEEVTIIGSKDARLPISLISEIASGNIELICIEENTPARIAFEMGKMVGRGDELGEVYSDIREIKALIDTPNHLKKIARERRSARPKTEKIENNAVEEEKKAEPESKEKIIKTEVPKKGREKSLENEAIKGTEEKQINKRSSQKRVSASTKTGYFAHIKEEDVDDFIRKNALDAKFKEPIIKALRNNGANDVTIDIMVRTQVAPLTDDKELCGKIGELAKKEFLKRR